MLVTAKTGSGGAAPLVRVDKAGVRYRDLWSVRDVSLSLEPGKIVTLIGPNGAGKSTTAKLVVGIVKPSEGRVRHAPNLRIGYVPQKLQVDWSLPLSVKRFMGLTHRLSAGEVRVALAKTGVSHLMTAELSTLSGGELQRVMLARAISRKPNLLVLDEPAQGVDMAGEVALYDLIGQTRDELNCSILLVSHDLHFVMASTDHVVCLNRHICCEGAPEIVAATSEYADLLGAQSGQQFAIYRHQHDHVHLPDGRVQHADGRVTDMCTDPCHDNGKGDLSEMKEEAGVGRKSAL